MSTNDEPFEIDAFAQHVKLCGPVQVTVFSETGGVILIANETIKALFVIETSVSDWCVADVVVQVSEPPLSTIPSTLITDRACSCQSPSSDPSNDAPGNSGSDDDGLGARGIWVWVGISGGLGLLLIAGLLVAAVLRRRCGPDRISCIPLDPWPFFPPSTSCPDLFLSLPPSLSSFGRLRRRSTRQVGDDDDDDDDAHDASMERAIALQPLNPAGESHGPEV